MISGLKDNLLRKDANADVGEEENSSVDARRARSQLYAKRLEKVLRYIRVNLALSPIRSELTDHINDEDDFERFLEAHELRESGDREGAREILDGLGIEKPAHKKAKGERGERPQA